MQIGRAGSERWASGRRLVAIPVAVPVVAMVFPVAMSVPTLIVEGEKIVIAGGEQRGKDGKQ